MLGLTIYMADGTYNDTVTMSSPASRFKAIRVKKEKISQYAHELDLPGVYMLLIDNDTVYVGESGFDTIGKRALNTHTGNIDSLGVREEKHMMGKKNIPNLSRLFPFPLRFLTVWGRYDKLSGSTYVFNRFLTKRKEVYLLEGSETSDLL